MTITIYTNPNCVQCDQTKRYFNQKEIPYETVDLSQDQEALTMVLELGFKSAPVVITDTDKWSGFRLERLHQTAEVYNRDKKSN
jgi:glutaredoxin-like protein NrdH